MLNIPSDLNMRYLALLTRRRISASESSYYAKWLRYYLDYCLKYGIQQEDKFSLSHFQGKLHEKRQTSAQVEQASHAITLYYELSTNSDTGKSETLAAYPGEVF